MAGLVRVRSTAWLWEALGWSCVGLGVTIAVRLVPVLRHAQGVGSLAYFVLKVFFVCVWSAVVAAAGEWLGGAGSEAELC